MLECKHCGAPYNPDLYLTVDRRSFVAEGYCSTVCFTSRLISRYSHAGMQLKEE